MTRFHFDITENQNSLIDDEGLDFPDRATMEHEAMRAAGTMLSELSNFPADPWSMVVRDDKRQTVAILTFAARYPSRPS